MDRYNGIMTRKENDPAVEEAFLPRLYESDNHAANLLELDNGDLLCAWFSGSGEGNPDTNVVMSRLPAGSRQWTVPEELSRDPGRSEQNPVLFQAPDGRVWLLHTSNEPHNQKTSRVVRRISEDRGQTWSEPEVLFADTGLFLRHPPVVLENGDWLLPCYYCTSGGHYSVVKISSDGGRTWEEYEVPGSLHRVQMNVLPLGGGRLYAMFRSRHADRIYTSLSEDNGRTWTAPAKSSLPNNNSSTQAVRLANGHLALIFNDATLERDQFRWVQSKGAFRKKALRTPLTLAVSEDEGRTWPHARNVQMADLEYKESEIGYSYPSIIASKDGKLHLAFSYLRKGIKYVRLEEDWVRGQ
jgi:predicted neuraminidase